MFTIEIVRPVKNFSRGSPKTIGVQTGHYQCKPLNACAPHGCINSLKKHIVLYESGSPTPFLKHK